MKTWKADQAPVLIEVWGGADVLVFTGPFPSKKNEKHNPRGGKAFLYKPETAGRIEALRMEALAQWRDENGPKAAASNPFVSWRFYLSSKRGDRDNMKTTLLDVMVKAGVLVNDNGTHMAGPEIELPTVFGGVDRCEVLIYRNWTLRPSLSGSLGYQISRTQGDKAA